jgi:hypothetical protein
MVLNTVRFHLQAKTRILACSVLFFTLTTPCYADMVSGRFETPIQPKPYSADKPESNTYGRGESGRMSEASMLRFMGDQDLQEHNLDAAIKKFAKAVMLDPGDPTGHMMYARAITEQLFTKTGPIDEELLAKCMLEWRNLQLHDADYLEQVEAKGNWKRLHKIAKAIEKRKQLLAKQEQGKAVAKAEPSKPL